ncbi:galactosamine-containing minor teichoic acid biosynthesis protein [Lachnospiraceae bacterium TWA4]|nr:galactosamine-containing minor teichoic acid biosynthesis protein [Lachnospiraceae bacterium TWA4]
MEVDNILQPIYGYDKKDIVLTGLARYDGLVNNDKKQILITPTWRRDVVNNGVACEKKTHNDYFKKSTYFKIYNDLINNLTLIETAKRTGYQIIYLLHPAMSSQSVDFDRNDYVQILEATGDMSYEKILTESSLMVTDYSGVQFDFAYMRKPVVYYHPDALPPFYEEGVFEYETMAFGEICKQEDVLIKTLCEYMENDCRCKEYYKERADRFFAYDDRNSCERIYHEVKRFLDEKN